MERERLNDRDGAMAEFREALRFRPDMARARTNLGELLAERGDKAAASEEVRLALLGPSGTDSITCT